MIPTLLAMLAFTLAACAPSPSAEASLPKTVGGETLVYDVRSGPSVIAADPDGIEAQLLRMTGMSAERLTVSTGYTSPELGYRSTVITIAGADANAFIRTWMEAMAAPDWISQRSIAGKPIWVQPVSSDPDPRFAFYYYVRGDTAIMITSPNPALVEEALAQLP